MRIRSARIKNYKSIGEEQKIFFNDRVSVIIGKNESGKTNILDAFNDINLLSGVNDTIKRKRNMKFEDDNFTMSIELEFDRDELNGLGLSNPFSTFKISDDFSHYCEISGEISEYFRNANFLLAMSNMIELITEFSLSSNDTSIRKLCSDMLLYMENFDCKTKPYFASKLENLGKFIINNNEFKDKWESHATFIREYVSNIYNKLPSFQKIENYDFKSTYTMGADFYDKKTGSDNAIMNLIKATNLPIETWEKATYKVPITTQEQNAQGRIRKAINELSTEFNEYFKFHNSITIEPHFSYSKFGLFVKSNELYSVPLDERSQGLRWYFNLFIEIKNNDLLDKNVMLLIDEPGVHLHVIAQKEVLGMFDKFSSERMQIVYTTHSPYMIDENKIYRVVATHKEDDDNTIISSSIFSDNLNPISKIDTLTPLIEAIGTKLKYNIAFPLKEKYIVTEGITDAMYINSFLAYFKDERYRAIPSKSASNVCHMCLLLFGLGFSNFVALFDNDAGGKRGSEDLIKSFAKGQEEAFIDEFKHKHVRFLSDIDKEFRVIEDLIVENEISSECTIVSKVNKAIFCTAVCRTLNNTPDLIDRKTIENFRSLISSI